MILTILTITLSFIFGILHSSSCRWINIFLFLYKANGNIVPCSTLSLEYCNNCKLGDTNCLVNCRECYTYNTFIPLFFNDFDGCLFEHCKTCPFDTYGCRTLCK